MHKVKCRICGLYFDTDEIEKNEWIMPSKNFYYHKICYDEWKVSSSHDDEDWKILIYDFIARDLKGQYDYFMCESQRKNFIKQHNFTNKGIYFALKYFYEIKKEDWSKSHGGIGIVPFVYKDAVSYWVGIENNKRGTMAALEKQIMARANMEVQRLSTTKKKTNKIKWNLEDI